MLIPRKTQARRGQVLLSLPAAVRHHLAVFGVMQVYWHVRVKGEATITVTPTRRGGQGAGTAGCPRCAELDEQVRQLTAQLHTRRAGEGRQYFGQGYEAALKMSSPLSAAVEAVNERLRRIEDALGTRRGPWRYKVKRGTPPVPEAAPAPGENQDAGGVLLASAEAAREVIQVSDSPAPAEE